MPTVSVFPTADALAERAADLVIETAAAAIRDRGRFTFALAGGSTPEKAYTLLAKPDRRDRIDWTKTLVFLGDERMVPADDSRSNFGMAKR
jgi:6-phosphogluconolactonase